MRNAGCLEMQNYEQGKLSDADNSASVRAHKLTLAESFNVVMHDVAWEVVAAGRAWKKLAVNYPAQTRRCPRITRSKLLYVCISCVASLQHLGVLASWRPGVLGLGS